MVPVRAWLVVCLGWMVSVPHAQSAPAQWMARASIPTPRAEIGAVRLDDKIYVAAGFDGGLNPCKEAWAYTPGRNSWQSIASLPIAMHHTALATVGGKLYLMGGVTNGPGGPHPNNAEWTGSSNAFKYDPAANQWTTVKGLPHSTAASGVVAFGGKIYVIGGIDSNGVTLDLVQEYDPIADSWAMRARMPTQREHVGVAVLDSLIYVVAGRVGQNSMGAFQAYSPASDKWYALPDMPTVRSDIGFAQTQRKFFALGGEKPGIFNINEEYDPDTKSWSKALNLTGYRKAFAAVNFQDTLFVFGGFSDNGLIATVEAFVPPGGIAVTGIAGRRTEGIRFPSGEEITADARDALGRRYPDRRVVRAWNLGPAPVFRRMGSVAYARGAQ